MVHCINPLTLGSPDVGRSCSRSLDHVPAGENGGVDTDSYWDKKQNGRDRKGKENRMREAKGAKKRVKMMVF